MERTEEQLAPPARFSLAARVPRAASRTEPRPLRVLGVVPSSFFSDYGCHVRVLEQAHALQARGHEIRLVTFPSGGDVSGLQIVRAPAMGLKHRLQIGPSLARLPLDLGLAWAATREARRFRPDVIIGYLHEGAMIGHGVARRIGVPLVFDLQGSLAGEMADRGWVHPGGMLWKALRRAEEAIGRRASLVLASSHTWADTLPESYGVPAHRIRALADCVDTGVFAPDVLPDGAREAELRRLGVPAGAGVVVYLGLLGEHQGTPLLLEAAARWPRDAGPVHFLIMGYPRAEEYRRLAASMRITDRVTFLGRIRYQDAPARLALGDIAVAPKTSTSEGHGKLVNYMAMGLPVVALNHPVNREYLGEFGVYSDEGPTKLAGALAGLLADPEKASLGAALRERSLSLYSCSTIGNDLEATLIGLVGARDASAVPPSPVPRPRG